MKDAQAKSLAEQERFKAELEEQFSQFAQEVCRVWAAFIRLYF